MTSKIDKSKDISVLITYSQTHQNSYINFMLKTLELTISNKNRYTILLGVDTGKKKNPDISKIDFAFDKMIQVLICFSLLRDFMIQVCWWIYALF